MSAFDQLMSGCLLVIACALGLLLILEALAWAPGYRKSVADQAERA
jgi:hypothetical protein